MFSGLFAKKAPPFDGSKLKANLKMSVTRLRMQQDKRRNNVRRQRREIAELIRANKMDSARVKVEGLIREHKSIDGLDVLAVFLELAATRVQVIEESKSCPPELKEALTSILWAVPREGDGVQEFHGIRLQLALKYGKEFCEMSALNSEFSVSQRVIDKLGGEVPPHAECVEYLEGIATEYGLELDVETLSDPGALLRAMEDPVGATGAGGAPLIAPIIVPRDELEARLLILSRA